MGVVGKVGWWKGRRYGVGGDEGTGGNVAGKRRKNGLIYIMAARRNDCVTSPLSSFLLPFFFSLLSPSFTFPRWCVSSPLSPFSSSTHSCTHSFTWQNLRPLPHPPLPLLSPSHSTLPTETYTSPPLYTHTYPPLIHTHTHTHTNRRQRKKTGIRNERWAVRDV